MIATSPLSGRIYSGAANRDKTAFIGNKKDVTSEVLGALIEKAVYHGGSFVVSNGERKWTVTVHEHGIDKESSDGR